MSALAQSTRMEVFRLLIIQGPDGLPAGEIATKLQVPHNTLSTHLTILVQAGLMQSRRSSRSIIYSINEGGVRELLTYLLQDCCKGRPELCHQITKYNQLRGYASDDPCSNIPEGHDATMWKKHNSCD